MNDKSLKVPQSASAEDRVLDLRPFKDLIKSRCGLSFDEARAATLETGIRTRMSSRGLSCPAQYLEHLKLHEDEFNDLVCLLTINETYFFRDPAQLQLLTEHLAPSLIASKKPSEKVRILSAGCSTGEEPYSIVMSLMEKYGESTRALFSVIGGDIDSNAFEIAKHACYGAHSFRDFPEHLKGTYFDSFAPNLFRVKEIVSDQVEFHLLNLLSETYPVSLKDLDVIFYRNVSIYFDQQDRKTIFSRLSDLLRENGYLVVGSSETLAHNIGIISLVEIDNQFLYQKKQNTEIRDRRARSRSSPVPGTDECPQPPSRRSLVTQERAQKDTRESSSSRSGSKPVEEANITERRVPAGQFDRALALAEEKKYDEVVRLTDSIIAENPSFSKAYTLKASVLINMKELGKAEETCLTCIEKDQWCLEAFLLLGMIAKIRNDHEKALRHFKESLYICSSSWIAHFCIAEIYCLRGELNRAFREYEIVTNLLKKEDSTDHGLTWFPLSFPMEQIAHLCRYQMAHIRKQLT